VTQDGSVSNWVEAIQQGDSAAAQQLFQRYFLRLVHLARSRLQSAPRRAADEEDVALSAFDSFCRNAERGCFPQLQDRDDLWRVLAVITARKASYLLRHEGRLKRGGEARQVGAGGESDPQELLAQVCGREPSPELAAQMVEEFERLLRLLPDDDVRQLARWRMEGHKVEEIATKLGCASRSVERKLQMIRTLWEHEHSS
jgi:DNA-directed RNA polymerase specialized sigma24 family protein